jgi:hypothetical protein
MIKLFIKVNIIVCLFITSFAQATLIPLGQNLSEDLYFEHTIKGINYDIAWASKVNTQKIYEGINVNILYDPTIRTGWNYADDDQLASLINLADTGLLLKKLTRDDKTLRHAFEFWNDYYTAPTDIVGTDDIISGLVASNLAWKFPSGIISRDFDLTEYSEITGTDNINYDTFYFRVQDNGSTPVPEPSTLMIFALGLIALASKKRLFS